MNRSLVPLNTLLMCKTFFAIWTGERLQSTMNCVFMFLKNIFIREGLLSHKPNMKLFLLYDELRVRAVSSCFDSRPTHPGPANREILIERKRLLSFWEVNCFSTRAVLSMLKKLRCHFSVCFGALYLLSCYASNIILFVCMSTKFFGLLVTSCSLLFWIVYYRSGIICKIFELRLCKIFSIPYNYFYYLTWSATSARHVDIDFIRSSLS